MTIALPKLTLIFNSEKYSLFFSADSGLFHLAMKLNVICTSLLQTKSWNYPHPELNLGHSSLLLPKFYLFLQDISLILF